MIFESKYRRQALDKWESEREEVKKELKVSLEKKRALTKNPLVYAMATLIAWFTQH
jgi:predicted Zn-dependent peptidase